VMNASYAVLRDWVLPSLLEIEAHSAGATYPHRVFEAGEVAVHDASAQVGSRTDRRVAALVAHEEANFSEAQAYLHALLKYLAIAPEVGAAGRGASYRLEPATHPSFLPGRAARVKVKAGSVERDLGFLGELHPGVLEAWGVRVPAGAFELSIGALADLLGVAR
jgi:phenylalanyl-tRNA synthetase beta chain